MKVYVASHYSRKLEVVEAVCDLKALGITVTSTWHKERKKPGISMHEVSESFCRRTAKRDVKELRAATHFILFTVDSDFKFTRGGHCVEQGWAQALGLRCLMVGPRQNVFCYLPGFKRVDTWEEGKKWLAKQMTPRLGQFSDCTDVAKLLGSIRWPSLMVPRSLPKASGHKIYMYRPKNLGAKCQSTKQPKKTSRSSKPRS